MFTWGLEHVACGAGTAHRMETRPVAANQHQTYEESYESTDWCGHSSAVGVTRVGCVCWHASRYPWHSGKLDGRSPSIGFDSRAEFKSLFEEPQFGLNCAIYSKLRTLVSSADHQLILNMKFNATNRSFVKLFTCILLTSLDIICSSKVTVLGKLFASQNI